MPRRAKQTKAQRYADMTCRAFRQYIANRDVDQFHVAVEWLILWIGRAGKDKWKPAPKPRPRETVSQRKREEQVAEVFAGTALMLRPAEACRVLNLAGPCEWCPVLPPRAGERCAVVPSKSRGAVLRVLERLVRQGRLRKDKQTSRRALYAGVPNDQSNG